VTEFACLPLLHLALLLRTVCCYPSLYLGFLVSVDRFTTRTFLFQNLALLDQREKKIIRITYTTDLTGKKDRGRHRHVELPGRPVDTRLLR